MASRAFYTALRAIGIDLHPSQISGDPTLTIQPGSGRSNNSLSRRSSTRKGFQPSTVTYPSGLRFSSATTRRPLRQSTHSRVRPDITPRTYLSRSTAAVSSGFKNAGPRRLTKSRKTSPSLGHNAPSRSATGLTSRLASSTRAPTSRYASTRLNPLSVGSTNATVLPPTARSHFPSLSRPISSRTIPSGSISRYTSPSLKSGPIRTFKRSADPRSPRFRTTTANTGQSAPPYRTARLGRVSDRF